MIMFDRLFAHCDRRQFVSGADANQGPVDVQQAALATAIRTFDLSGTIFGEWLVANFRTRWALHCLPKTAKKRRTAHRRPGLAFLPGARVRVLARPRPRNLQFRRGFLEGLLSRARASIVLCLRHLRVLLLPLLERRRRSKKTKYRFIIFLPLLLLTLPPAGISPGAAAHPRASPVGSTGLEPVSFGMSRHCCSSPCSSLRALAETLAPGKSTQVHMKYLCHAKSVWLGDSGASSLYAWP